MTFAKLTTEHYLIRAFEPKDLQAFANYRAQPEVAKYQSWSEYSYQDAVALYQGMDYASFGTPGNWYQLAIVEPDSDQLIGDLALHFIDQQQVEIGFTVDPTFQRRNVASEAIHALLGYLFLTLNKHRVIAITDTQNIACWRLLEKLSFRREAHFQQNIFFKGAWGDEYQYAMLCSEFVDSSNNIQ